jgi:plastocyanin
MIPDRVGANTSLNFEPPTITVVVDVNNTVVWVDNDTTGAHDISILSAPVCADVPPASPILIYGSTYSATFTVPGTYRYECQFHAAWMTGTIVVEAS